MSLYKTNSGPVAQWVKVGTLKATSKLHVDSTFKKCHMLLRTILNKKNVALKAKLYFCVTVKLLTKIKSHSFI